jgi:exopolysaccharide biosynthesis polyprenyl glycosylphosphotransferase
LVTIKSQRHGSASAVKEIFQTVDEQSGLMTAAFDEFILVVAAILAWTIATAASPSSIDPTAALLFAGIQFVDVVLLFLIGVYVGAKHRALDIMARLLITIAGAIVLSRNYWSDEQFWVFAGLTVVIAVSSGWLYCSPVFVRTFARMHFIVPARRARPVIAIVGDDATIGQWRADLEKTLGSRFAFAQTPLPASHECGVADAALRDRCLKQILQFATSSSAANIVIAPGAAPWLYEIASELKLRGCNVVGGEAFVQRQLRAIEPSDAYKVYWAFHCPAKHSLIWRIEKRACDVTIAIVLFFVTLPVLAACAAAIRLSAPGPVLYRQTRVGLNGQPFVIYKLRSMRADAEACEKPQWASQRDPRVTPVGRWLRRYHVDELPQLFNILKGDMSFVGPRPERPEFVELLTARVPCYRIRHAVKPGLTGWAQINYPYGASIEDARRKLAFDLFYVERAGVLFDVFIIMRTFRVVALGEGAR